MNTTESSRPNDSLGTSPKLAEPNSNSNVTTHHDSTAEMRVTKTKTRRVYSSQNKSIINSVDSTKQATHAKQSIPSTHSITNSSSNSSSTHPNLLTSTNPSASHTPSNDGTTSTTTSSSTTPNTPTAGPLSSASITSNTSGIFLDIEIYKGQRFGSSSVLDFKVYHKEQNSYLYLAPIHITLPLFSKPS